MRENEGERIVEKLQAAARARENGFNCPEALLEAYREELGENYPQTVELAEMLPAVLGESELCDVFAVTFAIIVQLTGTEDSYGETVNRLRREYGTSGCASGREETSLCTQRMKDCVLLIQWARENYKRHLQPMMKPS